MKFPDTASDCCLFPRLCVGQGNRAFSCPACPLGCEAPSTQLLPDTLFCLQFCQDPMLSSPCGAEEAGAAHNGWDVLAPARREAGALTSLTEQFLQTEVHVQQLQH